MSLIFKTWRRMTNLVMEHESGCVRHKKQKPSCVRDHVGFIVQKPFRWQRERDRNKKYYNIVILKDG